ncbi:NAD(P)/FAD-dependent oxidoreductase [Neptunicoccus cionae]|uniref:NAD(P)/FAD-dependent oxidoreductase n=1 Tax=Neptunicoccus cionae TaxID=2035344 RepID=UPI000C77D1EF|nr:FAD-dependent oxidoreductase [Amylibacter cionae]PLS20030.1 amino acid oxidase [Amylibacter cionae]
MRVSVVGAGIWGLASAYACALRGDEVTVYEAGEVGCGASGGIVGALAPLVPDQWTPKKQFQFESLHSAANFWAEVDKKSGQLSGYGRIGRVQPLQTERAKELAVARAEESRTLWQGKYQWTLHSCPEFIAPEVAPLGVIHDTLSARIFPAQAARSLALACKTLGVKILENHRVESLHPDGFSGAFGRVKSDAVILSAGSEGFRMMDPYVPIHETTGVKGQAALLDADLTGQPQVYAGGVYVIPHANGTVAIGSTSETSWDYPEPDGKLDAVIAQARAMVPALADAPVLQRWAGIRPKARRRDPMVGKLPELERVFTVSGAFKIGFGLAHSLGEVMARMIRDEPYSIPESFTVEWHLAGG